MKETKILAVVKSLRKDSYNHCALKAAQEPVTCPSQLILIRSIQQSRNEEPCFATDKNYSCGKDCEWRADCRIMMAGWC